MQLDTVKFGQIEIDEGQTLRFVAPILGFAQFQSFVLLDLPATAPIRWLQSTESPELAFPVIDPFLLVPDYDVAVNPGLLKELGAEALSDLHALTIVVVAKDVSDIRTNLRAPVIYNPTAGLAQQVVLEDSDYPVRHYFAGQRSNPSEAESVNASA